MASFTRLQFRQISWMALIAMLCLTLSPAISHALAASRGQAPWSEICTPQGLRHAATADASGAQAAGTDAPVSVAAHFERCPYCTLPGDLPGMPPAGAASPLLAIRDANPPLLFLAAPRTLFVWRSALARAPPARS